MGEEMSIDKKTNQGLAPANSIEVIDLTRNQAPLRNRTEAQRGITPPVGLVASALAESAPQTENSTPACPPECGVEYDKRPSGWNIAVGPIVQSGKVSISGAPHITENLTGYGYPVPGTIVTNFNNTTSSNDAAIEGIGLTVTHSVNNGPLFVGGGVEIGEGDVAFSHTANGTQKAEIYDSYGQPYPVEVDLSARTNGRAKVKTTDIFATVGGAWNLGKRWVASLSARVGYGKTSVDANGTSSIDASELNDSRKGPDMEISATKSGVTYGADAGLEVKVSKHFGIRGTAGYGAGPSVSVKQNGYTVAAENKGPRAGLMGVLRW